MRFLCALLALLALSCSTDREEHRARRIKRYDGPVIDVHAHLVWAGTPEEPEAFKKNAADPHVTRLGAVVTAPLGKLDETRALNDRAFAAAKENPKIFVVASVHPYDGAAALTEVDRVADLGAKMIGLDVQRQRFDLADPRVATLAQRCGERGLVIMVESSTVVEPATFGKVLQLALDHPQTQLVIAQMGLTSFGDAALFAQMKKNPAYADNVFFDVADTAALYARSPFAEQVVWIIRRFPRNVMFGSDFPLETSGAAIDAVQSLGLEENEQADVLYGNAARLLKL